MARSDSVSLNFCLYLLVFLLLLLLIRKKPFLFTALFGLSYGLMSMAVDVQRIVVDELWLNQKINITATIHEVRKLPQYTRLRISDVVKEDGGKLSGFADVYLYRNPQLFLKGMQIKTRVKLHKPHNKLNPARFDYEQYAFEQHIAAMGSVSGAIEIVADHISWLESLRAKIRASLTGVEKQSQGILSALLLADRSLVPIKIGDAFAASGATHLLAISGLHVGLVAGWGFMLAWWLLTRREAWIVNLPVRSLSLTAGLLLAMAYATLAGWPVPAQRASLMLLAAVVAWLLRTHQSPLNTMLAALLVITLLDPASVLSVSLWLSFIATSALLIWATMQPKTEDMLAKVWMWLKGLFWVSVIASLATLPLIGLTFERLPVWGLVANALLVPLYALWVLPLALMGELASVLSLDLFAGFFFEYSAMAIHMGNEFLLYIQTLPAGSLWLRGDKPIAYVLLGLTLLFCGLLILKQRYKSSVPLICLTLLMYAQVMLSESEVKTAELHVWDVGQGASALLRLPGFNLLVDVPGKSGSKFNGGTIAAENARALGLLHFDAVLLSHAQSDHAGGISRLLASMNGVGELWLADVAVNRSYPAIKDAIKKVKVRWLKKGDVINLDHLKIKVLWPAAAYEPNNGNNASLVLLLTLNTGQTILLPGDIEKQVERAILADLRPVDVMLMPHHGSKTSSTAKFVKTTQAKTVIAQTGYKNHYGFPKEEVMQRYHGVGSQVWNTAAGAVSVYFSKKEFHTEQYKLSGVSKRGQLKAWLFTRG